MLRLDASRSIVMHYLVIVDVLLLASLPISREALHRIESGTLDFW